MSDASAHEPGPQPSRSLLSRLPTPVKAVLVGAGVVSAVSVGYEVVDTANDAAVSVTESAVSSINDGDLALARQVARDVLPSPSDLTSPPVQTFGVTAAVGVVALRSRRKSRKGPAAEALAGQLVATVEPVSYPADASVDAPRLESQQLTFINGSTTDVVRLKVRVALIGAPGSALDGVSEAVEVIELKTLQIPAGKTQSALLGHDHTLFGVDEFLGWKTADCSKDVRLADALTGTDQLLVGVRVNGERDVITTSIVRAEVLSYEFLAQGIGVVRVDNPNGDTRSVSLTGRSQTL